MTNEQPHCGHVIPMYTNTEGIPKLHRTIAVLISTMLLLFIDWVNETGSFDVDHAGLELAAIPLPQTPECQDYRNIGHQARQESWVYGLSSEPRLERQDAVNWRDFLSQVGPTKILKSVASRVTRSPNLGMPRAPKVTKI